MNLSETFSKTSSDLATCACVITSTIFATGSIDRTVKLWVCGSTTPIA